MLSPLNARLRERRERCEALERELLEIRAEIRAYEDALRLMQGNDSAQGAAASEGPSDSPRHKASGQTSAQRSKVMSPHWAGIIAAMGERYPSPTSIAEIVELAAAGGFEMSKPTARSQMSLYTGRGITERVSEGQFTVSPAGLKKAGLADNREAKTGEAS